MDEKKKSSLLLYLMGVLQAFIGLTAILGGFELVSDPSGAKSKLPLQWLSGSPFPDYFIPGVILLTVVGVGSTIAAAVTFFRSRYAGDVAVALATSLIIYMTVEIWFVGLRNLLQPSYFILGVIVIILGLKLSGTFRKASQSWVGAKMNGLPT